MNDGLVFALVFVLLLVFVGGLTHARHRLRRGPRPR
jgi:hypothetical protein